MKEQIKVELLDFHGSDNAVANAARVSFADFDSWNEIPGNYSDNRRNGLITYLADHRHLTPFRHTSVSLRCSAPIFIARQLGKHQAGLSWNEVSRRYVDKDFEFFKPEEWRARPEGGIKQGSGSDIVESIYNDYGELSCIHKEYDDFINKALDIYNDMLLQNVAPEMARMVLPQSMQTEWVWTGNLLAFAHIYKERSYSGAQLEAQWFAEELDNVLRPLFPIAWTALVGTKQETDFNKGYEG